MCYINCKQYEPKKIEFGAAMKSGGMVDKGSVFSMRHRRMQIVLASLFVLIGLYIASGSGLLATFSSDGQAYSDIPSSHYAYEQVQRLHAEGVLGNMECSSGKFCPADSTDRKTAAVWIIRTVMDEQPATVSNSRFSDIDAGDWKAKYIEEFAERGITSGCGDDENGGRKFCPDNNVLRKHMAIFIVRAFDLPPAPDAGFEDVRSGTYFDSINRLAGVGITTGCGGTNFCPDQVITRAQAAIMLGRALEWRDGPLEPERDTTSPTITVSYTAGNSPSLTASANEEVTDWAHIGPLNSADCANNFFGRGTRPGSSVALDGGDNGKWYCFRAKDAANNWGFKSRRVSANAVDTTKPIISFAGGRVISDVLHVTFTSNEPVKWSLQHSSNKPSSCSKMSFFNAATDYTTTHGFQARAVANGLRYYCLRGVDSGGQTGYSKWYLVDQKKPIISLAVVENRLEASVEDDSSIHDILYRTFETKHVDCPKVDYSIHSRRFPTGGLDITSNLHDRWVCVRAMDDDRNRNKGHAGQLLVFTPSEPEPTSQLQPARFTSPAGYQETEVRSTFYGSQSSLEGTEQEGIISHIDDNFFFFVKPSSNPKEHLAFQLVTPGDWQKPPKSWVYSTSGGNSRGFAVKLIDYIDVDSPADCVSELFERPAGASLNGYDFESSWGQTSSSRSVRNGWLPLFTHGASTHVCIKVSLKNDQIGGDDTYPYKIFVTSQPVRTPTTAEEAIYRSATPQWKDYNQNNFVGLLGEGLEGSNTKELYIRHLDARFHLYVADNVGVPASGDRKVSLAVNLPGQLLVGQVGTLRFTLEKLEFTYVSTEGECDKGVFDKKVYDVDRSSLSQLIDLSLQGTSSSNPYLCVKAQMKGQVDDGFDYHTYKIFSYKLDFSAGASVSAADNPQGATSQASRTLSTTETLATITWLRGEERVLSAQPQLEVADIIVNDTWESVALAEDASCDETAFKDTDEINQGSEVANPQANIQYCFRVQDEEGGTNYINALVTEASFAGLDAGGQSEFGVETDENSKLMLIVAIAGGVILLAVIVSIFVFISQSSRPKFG